jgi:hypothetical protein
MRGRSETLPKSSVWTCDLNLMTLLSGPRGSHLAQIPSERIARLPFNDTAHGMKILELRKYY